MRARLPDSHPEAGANALHKRKTALVFGAAVAILMTLWALGRILEQIAGTQTIGPSPSDTLPATPFVIADLRIEVVEDGMRRQATLVCSDPVSGTGYLAPPEASGAACVTLLINVRNLDFVSTGERPDLGECRPLDRPVRRSAVISGRMEDEPIDDVRIKVETMCDARLWDELAPLFEPRDEPVLLGNADG
jgi:hypothetical protein